MITNLSIPVGQLKSSTCLRLDANAGKNLNNFPFLYIDEGSYIVSAKNENGLNINPDYVYNLHIGKYCSIAHDVVFMIDLNHDYTKVNTGVLPFSTNKHTSKSGMNHNQPSLKRKGQVLIQNDVWIGRGALINGGVTIHNGAIIAANSVVTKDVPAYSIVGGNPAKVIKYRFSEDIIDHLQEIQWWNWSEDLLRQNAKWFEKSPEEFTKHFLEHKSSKRLPSVEVERQTQQYLYIPDFEEAQFSTWKNVLRTFCYTYQNDSNCGIFVFLLKDKQLNSKIAQIEQTMADIDASCHLFLYAGYKEELEVLFTHVDFFITSRLKDTVYYSCLADRNNVKIISGVDVPLFQ